MIRRLASLVLAAMVVGCSAGDERAQSSANEASVETLQEDAAASMSSVVPDDEPAELSTTVVTEASQVDSSVETDPDPEPTGVQPEGFSTTTVRITAPDGEVCEVCMWLADDANERGRGLMGVTDLGDAAGMVFAFERLGTGSFFMFQTVTPLSIAWFDDDGAFVSAADMDPCTFDDGALCDRFPADGPYLSAIEVFQGDLESVGIEPGSTAVIVAGTEADTCPAAR